MSIISVPFSFQFLYIIKDWTIVFPQTHESVKNLAFQLTQHQELEKSFIFPYLLPKTGSVFIFFPHLTVLFSSPLGLGRTKQQSSVLEVNSTDRFISRNKSYNHNSFLCKDCKTLQCLSNIWTTKDFSSLNSVQVEWDSTGHLSTHNIHQCPDAYKDIPYNKKSKRL